jgi:SAM-dependent methyltransferase
MRRSSLGVDARARVAGKLYLLVISMKTDRDWEKWAQQNAYYGVLASPEYDAPRMTDTNRARFFASGETHLKDVLQTAQACLHANITFGKALDFGCGVGRVLTPLARRFREVVGIDSSDTMRQICAQNLPDPNIRLLGTVDSLSNERGSFDFIHSFIVFQHIRPSVGYKIFQQLLDLGALNSVYALHLTVGDLRRWRARANWFRYRIPPLHWMYNVSRSRPIFEPMTEMNRYDMAKVLRLLQQMGVSSIYAQTTDHNDHIGAVLYFLKPWGLSQHGQIR